MKALTFIVALIILEGFVLGMYALIGDTYSHGRIMTKTLLMGRVGVFYGLLRAIYRKWLVPEEENKQD